jgi:hypothetical protein
MKRHVRTLRRVGYVALGLVLVLFLVMQGQQRMLRHRAEKLHAEIVALQLKPGTFADVQRMQREWGKFGHYDGECTARHCIYQIKLDDWFEQKLDQIVAVDRRPEADRDRYWKVLEEVGIAHYYLGARVYQVDANVRIDNNRMWGAAFGVATYAYPGTGRNNGHSYVVTAEVDSNSRLFNTTGPNHDARLLKQGFWTMYDLECLGCQMVVGSVTPQTDPSVIERLNRFSFSCMTRLIACRHPVDLAPELWAEAIRHSQYPGQYRDEQEEESAGNAACQVPSSTLAREANDILLVKVLSVRTIQDPDNKETGHSATVQVLQAVKNGHRYRTSDTLDFGVEPLGVKPENGETNAGLVPGKQYFFLYQQESPKSVFVGTYLRPCHGLLNTPENAAAVQAGILLDPSTGESYDWWNDADPEER